MATLTEILRDIAWRIRDENHRRAIFKGAARLEYLEGVCLDLRNSNEELNRMLDEHSKVEQLDGVEFKGKVIKAGEVINNWVVKELAGVDKTNRAWVVASCPGCKTEYKRRLDHIHKSKWCLLCSRRDRAKRQLAGKE